MQFFVTTVLTAAMLVHATLGCCFHHSHAWESGGCQTPASDRAAHPGVSHCDGHGRHEEFCGRTEFKADDHNHHQCPHKGPLQCKDVKCSFARTESSPDVESLQLHDYLTAVASTATSVAQNADMETGAASFVPDVACDMPRLYIVLRVLLI